MSGGHWVDHEPAMCQERQSELGEEKAQGNINLSKYLKGECKEPGTL